MGHVQAPFQAALGGPKTMPGPCDGEAMARWAGPAWVAFVLLAMDIRLDSGPARPCSPIVLRRRLRGVLF